MKIVSKTDTHTDRQTGAPVAVPPVPNKIIAFWAFFFNWAIGNIFSEFDFEKKKLLNALTHFLPDLIVEIKKIVICKKYYKWHSCSTIVVAAASKL